MIVKILHCQNILKRKIKTKNKVKYFLSFYHDNMLISSIYLSGCLHEPLLLKSTRWNILYF